MIKRSTLLPLIVAFVGLAQAADKPADTNAAKPADAHAAPAKSSPKADPAKGQQTASTVCAGCHGADGNSPVPVNPKLASQHAAYLVKQLKDFKGDAAKPAQRTNPIMNGMVAALTEADMLNVAAYYSSAPLKPDTAKNQQTLALGQKLYRAGDAGKGLPACAACHGPNGAGIPDQFPRIGGQYADYTEAQLKAFRDGARANDPNKAMRAVAIKMTDAEIKAVADYVAGLR